MKGSFVGFIAVLMVLWGVACSECVCAQTVVATTKKRDHQVMMLLPERNDSSLAGKFEYSGGNLYCDKIRGCSYDLKITDIYSEEEKQLGITIGRPFYGILIGGDEYADTIHLDLSSAGILKNVSYNIDSKCLHINSGYFLHSSAQINSRSTTYWYCSFKNSHLTYHTRNLLFSNCEFDSTDLDINDSYRDGYSIQFYHCLFTSHIDISLADTMYFDSVESHGIITLKIGPGSDTGLAYIYLRAIDLDILRFPDYGIHFIVSTDQPYTGQVRLYKQLVAHYADITDEKRVYDIELQKLVNGHEHRWFVDWVEEHWSNYGYDKNLIFRNSMLLMLFFFGMNLFVFRYPRILYNGYVIEEFILADQRITDRYGRDWQYYLVKGVLCLIYTGYIFWGVKLSVDKIKLSNLWVALWIITQYVTGIICLAYIANVIITKV